MKRKQTSMLSPERVSLLLLAIAIIAWALTATVKQCSSNRAIPIPKAVVDTIVVSNAIATTDTVEGKDKYTKDKKGTGKKAKKERKRKEKAPVRHRDHLREPISE